MSKNVVDWLSEQIEQYILTHGNLPFNVLLKFRKQSKEIFRQQIIDAHNRYQQYLIDELTYRSDKKVKTKTFDQWLETNSDLTH